MTTEDFSPLNIPAKFRTLESEEKRLTVRDVWKRFLAEALVVEPDFQRHYIWDAGRASRYIESLLTGIPTPAIFVAEEMDDRWVVVDGHQRLGTLFRFMLPLLREKPPSFVPASPLKLSGLEVLTDLNGRDISALSIDNRRKLWETALNFTIIPKTAHEDMKYEMFARLNLGSANLNPQELRNCLYRGAYNRLIADLSETRDYLRLWGKNASDKRMKDRERVLTFFALVHRRERYRTPFRNFLNDEMDEHRDLTPGEAAKFSGEFRMALKWVDRVFTPNQCFRRFEMGSADAPQGRWIQRRMDLIHDVELVGFGVFGDRLDQIYDSIGESDKRAFLGAIRSRLVSVMASQDFKDALGAGVRQARNQELRLNRWMRALEYVVSNCDSAIKARHTLDGIIDRQPDCVDCEYPVAADDAVVVGNRVGHRYCRFAAATQ